ncbi:hypothetical protein ACWGDX_02925 [Streptomyces sp. NPDC055025]
MTLPGLYIDMGEHARPWSPQRDWWLRQPYAELRCPAGCVHPAAGAAAVIRLLSSLDTLRHNPPAPPGRQDPDR